MSALQNDFLEIEGPDLDVAQRLVIVIHGMSTTVSTLRTAYPAPLDGSITKLYWHLPILRQGVEAVRERRNADVFRRLFASVIDESRAELSEIMVELGNRPMGLFGFSIGGLLALWGAIDHSQVRAVVTIAGVPSLNYLPHYYPEYPWLDAVIQQQLASYDLVSQTQRLARLPVLVCHGDADEVAQWPWMQPFVEQLQQTNHQLEVHKFPHVQHRLLGDAPAESRELRLLLQSADDWFNRHLTSI